MSLKWVGKPIIRTDALDKVTGKTKYMTDLSFPEMLWGKIVRAGIPHAEILEIDTSEAEEYQGIHAVVTHQDVSGRNGYGIVKQDQPVFCKDKVRYEGDAVCGVVAETKEIAEEAAKKIKIKYKELPGIFKSYLESIAAKVKLLGACSRASFCNSFGKVTYPALFNFAPAFFKYSTTVGCSTFIPFSIRRV